MTRLAVMDPAAGRQPMVALGGEVVLVFNGEVYNFREIRTRLESLGHSFRTNSDTEVVLAAYLEYGKDCVRQFVGMFAFAVYDGRVRSLLLARDRFGKKPLYFTRTPDGGIAFSSEIKGLLPIMRSARVEAQVDPQGVYDYLSLGVVPQPSTIYRGVQALQPGSTLTFSCEGTLREEVYWEPSFTKVQHSDEDLHVAVRELIREAVRIRLRSDVPLGLFLSGGVDSSVIAHEAALLTGGELQSFTVQSVGELDESDVASRTASSLGITNTVLPLEMDPVLGVEEVVRVYDQPFADSSAIPSLAISKLAREHVTVVLNGDGGDEVFGGYRRHVAARLAAPHGRVLGPASRLVEALVPATAARRGPLGFGLRLARGLRLDPAQRYLAWTTDMLREPDKASMWRGGPSRPTERLIAQSWSAQLDSLDQQLNADIRINLLSDLLVKMDMATMAHSLEGRSPLLDHRLAEFVWSLDARQRLPRGRPKGLLRNAYAGILSDEVVTGKKRGFEIPMASWLHDELAPLVHDVLLVNDARVHEFVEPEFVRLIMLGGLADRNTTYLRYALLVLEMWLRRTHE